MAERKKKVIKKKPTKKPVKKKVVKKPAPTRLRKSSGAVKKKPVKKAAVKKSVPKKKVAKKPALKKTVKKPIKKPIKKPVKKKVVKKPIKKAPVLRRSNRNPILTPTPHTWESNAVFNPAAIELGGRIHLFYRALGDDGVSRLGYASSRDGITFDTRLEYPVYVAQSYEEAQKHFPYTSPARLVYNTSRYHSGGGWGGCEDPRAVLIDGIVYLTFNMFGGWNSMRVAVTAIREEDLLNQKWRWSNFAYLSRDGDRQKNWVLFPEKINGKFALFHNLDKGDPSRVHIAFMENLNMFEAPHGADAPDPQTLPDHDVAWHHRTRSAAAPPIKTRHGWLLIYHAMERADSSRYKVGAMLLDLKDPTRVIARAPRPILEPDLWYENNWKPGIVYANGAVARGGELFVYYGGGDKYIGVGTIAIDELIAGMKAGKPITLSKRKIKLK